jgi:hypothetical protein
MTEQQRRESSLGPDTHFCPACGADWYTGFISPKGKPYSRLIGIEIPEKYDGVSFWRCPDCTTEWDRFTGMIHKRGNLRFCQHCGEQKAGRRGPATCVECHRKIRNERAKKAYRARGEA